MDMETIFSKETPLTVSHGNIHNYLGMMFDFSESGNVLIHMSYYVKHMLHDAPDDMDGKVATPVAAHLSKVDANNPKPLPAESRKSSCAL